jgi:hypothetical protein
MSYLSYVGKGGEMLAEFGRGIKAGVVSCVINGVIFGIMMAVVISIWTTEFAVAIGATIPAEGVVVLADMWVVGAVIGSIIGGIIGGIIFGAIYAAVYGHLPGATSVVKGIVLSIIVWLVLGVPLNFAVIAALPIVAVLGLISSLIWGALIGVFWDKFGGKHA